MTNNILTIADGDYGYPTSTIATLVQGQYGQSLPLEIRDLAGNVVNLTGFSTLSAIKSSERGRVTSIVGAITLSGTPTVAPQLSWLLDEADTGIAGTFNLVLSISNGTVTHETHPVELVILPNPAINAVAAPGVVGITTAQKTLLAAIQGLTGLVKIAAGSATGVAIQSFMQTFLESATVVAARIGLLPSYTGNTGKVLAVNGAETDVEWVAQSGGGAVWGEITGTLTDQEDLTTYLEGYTFDLTSVTGNTSGNYARVQAGDAPKRLEERTPAQVLADIGAVATSDIGTTVQAHSVKTAAIASLTWAANSIILLTGTATASVQALAAHVVTFLQSANAADARSAIGAAALGANTFSGEQNLADQLLTRPVIKDYGETVNAIGSTGGGTQDIDLTLGNVVSATVDTSANTFTFSNPSATGTACSFTLILTNGGSQTVNWPASVDWAGGTAPTLTAAGVDILTFATLDGGTIWYGFAAGLDMQ